MRGVLGMAGYRKFNWVGNKISDTDMVELHRIKQKHKIPITKQVAQAVREYITRKNGD